MNVYTQEVDYPDVTVQVRVARIDVVIAVTPVAVAVAAEVAVAAASNQARVASTANPRVVLFHTSEGEKRWKVATSRRS